MDYGCCESDISYDDKIELIKARIAIAEIRSKHNISREISEPLIAEPI